MNNIDDMESLSTKLRRIARLYTMSLSGLLTGFDIDKYFDVLLILARQNGPVTQKQLAAGMHIDKSRIVAMLKYLQQKQYVEIEKNPRDRREHFVKLSVKGAASIPLIREALVKNDRIISSDINETEFNNCLSALSTIEKSLTKAVY